MIIAILGRQPKIGYAELQSVLGQKNVSLIKPQIASISGPQEIQYQNFGSVIKFADVKSSFSGDSPTLLQKQIIKTITNKWPEPPAGKINLGISSYNSNIKPQTILSMALSIKKNLRAKGYAIRVVPNKGPTLSSAQVIHNKLASSSGVEVIVLRHNGTNNIAHTIYEQDIEAYASRDQARPKRDARVGMLPPKLAQTIINLATSGGANASNAKLLLDPFCGTGVVLQEALLMGYQVYGSDIEPKMIDYSETNLKWLKSRFKDRSFGSVKLQVADATANQWSPMPDFIACETFLGRPLSKITERDSLNEIISAVNTIHKKFFENLAKQIKPGTTACIAVPAWQIKKGTFKTLPVLDQLTKIGYNQLEFKDINPHDLIYAREDQIVGRQLVALQFKGRIS